MAKRSRRHGPSDKASGADFIVLRIREDSGLPVAESVPRVEVAVSCARCHGQRNLLHSYPLNPMRGLFEQLLML